MKILVSYRFFYFQRLYIFIADTPVIDVEHEVVHTGTGMKSELTCIVHAHPHANITWYKNKKTINEKKDKKFFIEDKSRRTLVIEHTTSHDLGQYNCVAKNKFGEATRMIELTGNYLFFSIPYFK